MALTLVDIANNIASVTLEVQGNSLTVEYYPTRVTEKSIAVLEMFGSLNGTNVVAGFESFNETLANLIKSWDFYEDVEKTKLVPIDPARFAGLPLFLRVQVLNAILGDIRPEDLAPQKNQTLN